MPNQDNLGFVAKVPFRNEEGEFEYRPLYLPPDATNAIKGDVKLSDDYSSLDASRLSASDGMTAFTPQGAYTMYGAIQGALQTKLSKTDQGKQSVTSDVDFAGKISTAELTLNNPVNMSIGVGGGQKVTSQFDGHSTVEMTIEEVPADKLTGTISMDRLPQGALERLVKYVTLDAAREAYTTAQEQDKPFQLGDSILITGTDPNRMFIAVGPDLTVEAGYVEYAAGTALKLGSETIGSATQPIYLNSGNPEAITQLAVANGGTGGSNVKEASANLKYTSLSSRSEVPNTDLNEVRIAGSYFDKGTIATSNLPGKDKFAYNLEVFENTDGTIRQQLRYYNDFNVWERIYSSKTDENLPALTNNWTSWSKAGGGSGGASSGLVITPGSSEGFDDSSGTPIDAPDNTSESEKIYTGSPSSSQDITIFTYNLGHLPLGAYSIIIRAKTSTIEAIDLLNVTVNGVSSDGATTVLRNMNIKGSYFQKANAWECLSFGVNLDGGRDWDFNIVCKSIKNSNIDIKYYIDYVRVIPSGTALGSIG